IKISVKRSSIQNNFLLVTNRERVRCLTGGGNLTDFSPSTIVQNFDGHNSTDDNLNITANTIDSNSDRLLAFATGSNRGRSNITVAHNYLNAVDLIVCIAICLNGIVEGTAAKNGTRLITTRYARVRKLPHNRVVHDLRSTGGNSDIATNACNINLMRLVVVSTRSNV